MQWKNQKICVTPLLQWSRTEPFTSPRYACIGHLYSYIFEMAPFVLIVQTELFVHFLLYSYSDIGLYKLSVLMGRGSMRINTRIKGNDLCSFWLRMSGLNHSLQAFLLALSFSDRRIVLMHKCTNQMEHWEKTLS